VARPEFGARGRIDELGPENSRQKKRVEEDCARE